MRVGVQGDPDGRVPEPLRHDPRMDTLDQHQRGMSVPQIMEANLGEIVGFQEPAPPRRERVGVDRGAVAAVNDQPVLLPITTEVTALLLHDPLSFEIRRDERGQRNGTA